MNLIQQSIRDGSLVLYHDYRLGHAQDLSSYGNHGALVAPAKFQRGGVYIESLQATASISVPYHISMAPTTETCIALFANTYGSTKDPGDVNNSLYTRRAGSTDFRLIRIVTQPGNSITVQNPGVISSITTTGSHIGIKCFGISWADGAGATAYKNGVLAGTNATVNPFTAVVTPLYIGGGGPVLASRGIGGCISAFMLFNRLLTAAEHALVYEELMK